MALKKIREVRICIYKDGCRAEFQIKASLEKGTYMHVLIHDAAAQLLFWKKNLAEVVKSSSIGILFD